MIGGGGRGYNDATCPCSSLPCPIILNFGAQWLVFVD